MNVIGTERQKITAADFEMETTQTDRVLLPYRGRLWGDLLHHTLEAVLSCFDDECEGGLLYDEAVRETDVSILFNIQRRQIRATAYINALTTKEVRISTRLPMPAERSELEDVLDAFFAQGGAGLSPEYRMNYGAKYSEWRRGAA